MEADKLFVVMSASLLSLATIGFLLVKPLYEEKIKKKIEENEKLHIKQRMLMHWIEKTNSMRELADSKEDNINILRILNVPNTELEKNIQMLIDYHHSAAMNTINALLASNAICAKQGEALLENLQKLNIKELSFFYLENMEKSASANNKMSENVDENNRSIRKLERCKNSYWYLCFACQSFGLILGLIAIIFKK